MRGLSSRIKRLEARFMLKSKLMATVRVCPRTGTYLDKPTCMHIPEPYFADEADWENYHLTVQRELRKFHPERTN